MIDSDQGWEPKAVLEMFRLNKDFVTGAVPGRKHGSEEYALKIFTNEDMTPKVNIEGLIACATNGVAFGMIKRTVFEQIKKYKPYPADVYPYFQHKYFENGDHFGEDTYFTQSWLYIGEVWIYPNITFNHGGVIGNYHSFLLRQPKPEGIKNIEVT